MISVIMPVYNVRDYLKRCLDSILNQDFKDYEVILVDDGSTDGSGDICDEYAERYSLITVYHKKNEGASLARKYGLERAKGEYVTFVDSDDWVAPNYLSMLFRLIKDYNVLISACGVCRIKKGDTIYDDCKDYKSYFLPFEQLMPRFFKYEFWGFPGKLYLRSVLEKLTFPNATIGEDYYVMAQLFYRERQMAYTEEPLYFYEYHENSLSHQKLSKRAFEEFDNVKAVYDYTKLNMPEYTDYALSNLIETCVKLYSLVTDTQKRCEYRNILLPLTSFLKCNFTEIMCCKPLNYKVKVLALMYCLSPFIFYRLLR